MGNETNIILIVLAGSMIMFVLIMVIITFSVMYSRRMNEKDAAHRMEVKNKELEMLRAVINAEEAEREKIAMNIHDEIGPLLSSMKLNLTKHGRHLENGELTKEILDRDRKFMDEIIDNVRTVSHDLSPQYLMKFGLLNAIRNFCDTFDEPVINIESYYDDDLPVPRNSRNHIYCLAMELINNIIKHDTVSEMNLFFDKGEDGVVMSLKHNGEGITNEQFEQFMLHSEGLGLSSIKSRVIIINGKLDFLQGDSGARVDLRIPFKK